MDILETQFGEFENKAKVANSLRAFSSINLVDIKNKIKTLLALIGREGIFDEYTKHDISHIDRMLYSLDYLIPDSTKEKMTTADWLLIVLSFYFHDLGMLVTKNEFENRTKSKEFNKFKNNYLDKIYNANSLKQLSSENSEKFLYQEYVRKHHGDRIYNWILDEQSNYVYYDPNVTDTIRNIVKDFPPLFKNDLAIVCASHSLDDLEDLNKYKVSQAYGSTPQEKANVFYAALILRTADLMHITSDRTPIIEYQVISPTNPVSQEEWAKQAAVSSVTPKIAEDEEGNKNTQIQSNTLEVNAFFEKETGFFSLIEYLNYAREQLKNNHRLNEIAKKKHASKYDFPWKDIDDSTIQTKNFERRQLSFTIDQNKVLSLLVGETLYNNLSVSLRELAQNSIDAVKVRKYELFEKNDSVGVETYKPIIKVFWDSATRELIISDNGTGMNQDIIENHLLKVGSSRYQDPEFQKNHPGYNSISRFGIGLLTCFLIADDVDILTNMDPHEKPLLLKIRNVHGKYLLKHGAEKGSNLSLLEDVGTSIKLKIRPDIKNFNPEKILRHWIVIPQCDLLYVENGLEKKIGYDSPKDLLENLISVTAPKTDSVQVKVVEYNSEGIDLCLLLRYNSFFHEWEMVDTNEWFDINNYSVIPTGTSIEGIRIDSNTPGFNNRRFIAFANMTGDKAPKTNVARSNINSASLEKTLDTIYSLYLKNITMEKEKLCKNFSITWAAEEAEWMLATFLSKRNFNINADFSNKEILIRKLCEFPLVLIEQNYTREFKSIDELKKFGHYWTIESEAFDSANRLLKEIRSDSSVISLFSNLYTDNDSKTDNIDILLSKKRGYNLLDEVLLSEFQIADIRILTDQRRLDIKWDKVIDNNTSWIRISQKRDVRHHELTSPCFIQTKDIKFNETINYDAIKSTYGIILLYTSPITEYLNECLTKLNLNNEDDFNIIADIWRFIEMALTREIRFSDWERQVEQIFERSSSPRYYDFIFSKVSRDDLIKMCECCDFNIYDASKWYRSDENLPWNNRYW